MRKMKKHISTSQLVMINIKYGAERIRFNLHEELKISETKLEQELIDQPSYYGFCLLLHKKLLTEFERLKLRKNKMWGRLFLTVKDRKSDSTGRVMNDEMCKAWVDTQTKYIEVCEACIQAKDDADTIFAVLKGFEQRKDLMQTIASNRRAEKGS